MKTKKKSKLRKLKPDNLALPEVMRAASRMLAYHMVIFGFTEINITSDLNDYEVRVSR